MNGEAHLPNVAVIGAGLGGLSAAIRLAATGFAVDLYERSDSVGGKAGTLTESGFRFDTGPSLVTMKDVFDDLFSSVGRRAEEYLSFVPLPVICRYFYPDSTTLDAFFEPDRFGREIQSKTGEPAAHLARYLAYSKRIYEVAGDLFLRHSLHDSSTYGSALFWKSLSRIFRIDPLRTMDAANRSFFQSPKIRQLFDRYATYNGSSPYLTPATLNIIPHVEYGLGGYAMAGGIRSIPLALERLARELGVRFHFGADVERIEYGTPGGKSGMRRTRTIRGIRIGGEFRPYGIVISNVDVTLTYRNLLVDAEAPLLKRYERLESSSSGIVFYWGMRSAFPELSVNNIFFSSDYRNEFDQIFRAVTVPEDPTVYVNITSKVNPADAPTGGENWFVLINTPYDSGQDWDDEVARLRPRVLNTLCSALGRRIDREIVFEQTMHPGQIAERTGSYRGSLYGISSNSTLAAFLRHPNRSRRYPGLYLCGGSVHPGGGMPLAILSGGIAAALVQKDVSRHPESWRNG
jgi:phytoene desaturase